MQCFGLKMPQYKLQQIMDKAGTTEYRMIGFPGEISDHLNSETC